MDASLFDRLGGAPSVEAAVDIFYGKVLDDAELAPFFENVNMKAQRNQQVRFLTMALGGPNEYRGRDMRAAHANLALTDQHFDLVAGHLVATLQELDVPAPLIDEVVGLVGPLRDDVLGR